MNNVVVRFITSSQSSLGWVVGGAAALVIGVWAMSSLHGRASSAQHALQAFSAATGSITTLEPSRRTFLHDLPASLPTETLLQHIGQTLKASSLQLTQLAIEDNLASGAAHDSPSLQSADIVLTLRGGYMSMRTFLAAMASRFGHELAVVSLEMRRADGGTVVMGGGGTVDVEINLRLRLFARPAAAAAPQARHDASSPAS